MRIIFILLIINFTPLSAQRAVSTQLYGVELSRKGGKFEFTNLTYLSNFNPFGYNNQPSFINNEEFFLTIKYPSDTETDLHILNYHTQEKMRFTATKESEYSGQIIQKNGTILNRHFVSCIRVSTEENGKQYLWKYPYDRAHEGEAILDNTLNIGYYEWVDNHSIALFVVALPAQLVLYDLNEETYTPIAENVGRCIKSFSNRDIAYVEKVSPTNWQLKRFSPSSEKDISITPMMKGVEDFLILKDDTILCGKGSKLYQLSFEQDTNWTLLKDFSVYNIKDISRLAINPNQNTLLMVAQHSL